MRFEAKHSYFKKLAQNIGNFINVPWTLAMRHQMWGCYNWLNTDTLPHDQPDIGPGTSIVSVLMNGYECIAVCLDVKEICYCCR